jgi:hypothetical protein
VSQIWAAGADGSLVGMALFWSAAVLLMALCPIAAERTDNWRVALGAIALGGILATMTLGNAIDVAGAVRDLGRKPARDLVQKIATLESRITVATNSRSLLPQLLPQVTDALVMAATQAVDAAEVARVQECGKVGDNCRARVADKEQALERQSALLEKKAIAEAGKALDDKIDTLTTERQGLGAPPEDADPTAHRIAKVISLFRDLGAKPAEWVADWWPTWLGIGVEAIALLGSYVLVNWLLPPPVKRRWLFELIKLTGSGIGAVAAWRRAPAPINATPRKEAPPAREIAAPRQTLATPARPKKISKSKAKSVREFGSVREWKESRTVARADSRVRPGFAYEAYKQWCAQHGKEPVTLTAFGLTMKNELGVDYEEKSHRGWYVDIALVAAPKLAADNTRLLGSMAPRAAPTLAT